MKKSYKIEVDCANCANQMEDAAKKTPGVKDCTVSFMTPEMRASRRGIPVPAGFGEDQREI